MMRNTSDRREDGARNGSVLMETVLVLPLLMVLLGGVMWLGQIQLNRVRLVEADRYVAWQRANRHLGVNNVPDTDELLPFGFATAVGEDPDSISALQTAGTPGVTFWQGIAGGVEMRLQATPLVAGLLTAPELMDASGSPDPGAWRIAVLRGRPVMRDADAAATEAPGSYEGHFVLGVSPPTPGMGDSRYAGDRTRLGELGDVLQGPQYRKAVLEMDWEAVAREDAFP